MTLSASSPNLRRPVVPDDDQDPDEQGHVGCEEDKEGGMPRSFMETLINSASRETATQSCRGSSSHSYAPSCAPVCSFGFRSHKAHRTHSQQNGLKQCSLSDVVQTLHLMLRGYEVVCFAKGDITLSKRGDAWEALPGGVCQTPYKAAVAAEQANDPKWRRAEVYGAVAFVSEEGEIRDRYGNEVEPLQSKSKRMTVILDTDVGNGVMRKKSFKRSLLVAVAYKGHAPGGDVTVHHINHDRLDDRAENLALLTTSEHRILHWAENAQEAYNELTSEDAAAWLKVDSVAALKVNTDLRKALVVVLKATAESEKGQSRACDLDCFYRERRAVLRKKDPILAFDEMLFVFRAVSAYAGEYSNVLNAKVRTMLGNCFADLRRAVKACCSRDEMTRATVEELLADEWKRPGYVKMGCQVKMRNLYLSSLRASKGME